jgi:hypothetical protein
MAPSLVEKTPLAIEAVAESRQADDVGFRIDRALCLLRTRHDSDALPIRGPGKAGHRLHEVRHLPRLTTIPRNHPQLVTTGAIGQES